MKILSLAEATDWVAAAFVRNGCSDENALSVARAPLSKVARGPIVAAKQKGESIPEGWALDANGKPTTNPAEAIKGTIVPLGDAKGAALALAPSCPGRVGWQTAALRHATVSRFQRKLKQPL